MSSYVLIPCPLWQNLSRGNFYEPRTKNSELFSNPVKTNKFSTKASRRWLAENDLLIPAGLLRRGYVEWHEPHASVPRGIMIPVGYIGVDYVIGKTINRQSK
ncbi:MAG TPA: hypothetical protein PKB02_10835 [Anaerohalosphaeraceae bacterium]|nr:hypothetical protein [Anaerohalosphaeraceae bacterium]